MYVRVRMHCLYKQYTCDSICFSLLSMMNNACIS